MPSKDRKSNNGQMRKASVPKVELPKPEAVKGKRVGKKPNYL